MTNLVTSAIEKIGLTPIAKRLGYRPSAIQSWRDDGRLPKSELAGLTNYADVIEELSEGEFSAAALLSTTRREWEKRSKRRAPSVA